MNKIFKTIVLLMLCHASFFRGEAQTISDFSVMRLGESAPVQYALGVMDPGPSGTNVTWDYSGLVDDTSSYTWAAMNPANTAFTDSFPGASLAFRFPSSNGSSESWVYYDFDENAGELDYLGAAQLIFDTSGTDTFYQTLNADPERIQNFPFSYGDSFNDTFDGWNHVSFSGFNISQKRTGTLSRTADATGTLSTPAGTWSNVVRVHSEVNVSDTYLGQTTTMEIHRYTWYAQGEKYLLLHMDSIIQNLGPGGTNVVTNIFYRSGTPVTSAETAVPPRPPVKVWPQPAKSILHFSLPAGSKGIWNVEIFDLAGRQVRQRSIRSAGGKALKLNLEGLREGVYFLKVNQNSQAFSPKIIIQ